MWCYMICYYYYYFYDPMNMTILYYLPNDIPMILSIPKPNPRNILVSSPPGDGQLQGQSPARRTWRHPDAPNRMGTVDASKTQMSWGDFMGIYMDYMLVSGWPTPSEKYESQLGWWHSQYMEKSKMFQITNQYDVSWCIIPCFPWDPMKNLIPSFNHLYEIQSNTLG